MLFKMKRISVCLLLVFMGMCLLPSLLFAEGDDPLYDAPGSNPYRESFGASDFEHIDPFTGGLTLNFEDVRIPGNGGLDLVVQRTFNSKNSCRNWKEKLWNNQTVVYCIDVPNKGDSWIGNGWTMHFGKLLISASSFLVEMPDGATHETYSIAGSSDRITKDYWILQYFDGYNPYYVLKFTDGKKITFNYYGSKTSDDKYFEYYASKIEDANGNAINITYYDLRDTWGGWLDAYKGAIKSVTDSAGRVTNFSLTSSLIEGKYRLYQIVRPDNKIIQFNYILGSNYTLSTNNVLLSEVIPPEGASWKYVYHTDPTVDYALLNDLTKVTTPYGGVIDYTYSTETFNYGYGRNNKFASRAVKTKITSGREITSGTWNFEYYKETNNDYTYITDPCGRTIKHQYFGFNSVSIQNGTMWKIGLPISKEIITGSVMEEAFAYEWTPSSFISNEVYSVPAVGDDLYIYAPYLSQQVITRDGQTYTTAYSNFDSYGNPKTISEIGDTSRTTTIDYYWYNTTKNIVKGKPHSETVTGGLPGSFTTTYTYDTNTGNPTQLNRFGVLTNYTYYTNGNLQTVTDANSYSTSNEWTYGRISKVTNPIYSISRVINPIGTIASETNGRGYGYTTSYTYDGNLRLTGITPPVGNPTIISYQPDNSSKIQSRGGYWLKTSFDGFGRLSGTEDSKGIVAGVEYKSCGPKDYTTSNIGDTVFYDNFGRTTDVVHQDNNATISYDYLGNTVTVKDEALKPTILTYNAFGNPDEKYLVNVKDALYYNTAYRYNILGSLTDITQGSLTRSFTYNGTTNFLESETHPETGAINYIRYPLGNLRTKTDVYGTKTYTYDGLNRLRQIDFGPPEAPQSIKYGYDNADNRISMTSPGFIASYDYDAANRMTLQTETIGGITYTTEYKEYDGNDNLKILNYPTELSITYDYNTNNQAISVTGFGGSVTDVAYYLTGSSTGLPKSFKYVYDGSPNGLTTNITYNNRNLTTRITAGTIFDIGYGYTDKKGNTMSMTDYIDTKNQTFTYDELNRLRIVTGSWGTGEYTYDAFGNRKTKTIGGNTTYNYSTTTNRLDSTTVGEPASFFYNTGGGLYNLTQDGSTYTLEYDYMGNLKSYKLGAASLADFTYDGDGMRVTKTSGGKTTVYHHDQAGGVISETDSSGNIISDYVYLNGKLIAKITPNTESMISVTPASYGFGSVRTRASLSTTFTVTNTGTANLIIGTIAFTGTNASEFSKKPDNCMGQTLFPNTSCTIQVIFTPVSAGLKSANLSISSNDSVAPTLNVPLSGTGILQYTLLVRKTGTGSGTVTSSPAGINCGTVCRLGYDPGASVTLTAAPSAGSGFAGWSGEGCSGKLTCTLQMNATATVTAAFVQTWFEETDTAITYSGVWTALTCGPCSGGAIKYSGATGARATFSFNGTGLKWRTLKNNNLGIAKLYLDGVLAGSIDLYSSTVQYQVVLQKTGLAAGNHTGVIEVSGQKNAGSSGYNITLDAFEVIP